MLIASLAIVIARKSGKLVGFGRAWGDGVYRAVIDDLVVLPSERGGKIGTSIVERLLECLDQVEEVALSCSSETAPFYEKLGFIKYSGSHLKIKTDRTK